METAIEGEPQEMTQKRYVGKIKNFFAIDQFETSIEDFELPP